MQVCIGIDWGNDSHAICIRHFNTRRILAEFMVDHSVAGISQFEEKIKALSCTVNECQVAIETNQGMLVNYLITGGYAVHPIPPAAVKDYRGRRRRTGAKNDKDDAQLLSDILCQDPEQFPAMVVDSMLARELKALYRARAHLVQHRAQVINRLKHHLKLCFPAAIGLFSRLDLMISREFLTKYPTQQAVQQVSAEELHLFFKQVDYRQTKRIPQIITKLHEPSWPVPEWQARVGACLVRALVDELTVLTNHIKQLEVRMEEVLDQHADGVIFRSLPNVGTVLAAGFIGEIGDSRDKYADARALQALAGTAPVTQQSGPVKKVRFRRACNKQLRQLLQQYARQSARRSGSAWARGYLANQIERGHSTSRAYRALANRWLVIIYRMWQDRTLYDEAYHLRNIAQHGVKIPKLTLEQAA